MARSGKHDDPANIAVLERFYRKTGNPIYAWDGWRLARKNRLATPEWVARYLDECSRAVIDIARRIGPPATLQKLAGKPSAPRRNRNLNVAAAIARGFGFSRGRGYSTSFGEWMAQNERVVIGALVAERMARGESLSAAAAEVAHQLDISESSAERAYRGLRAENPQLVRAIRSSQS